MGALAESGGRTWRFAAGSLRWPAQLSRTKLNLGHERRQTVGRALRLTTTSRGLEGAFKVAEVPEGDRALRLAADGVWDGLSVEVDFDADDAHGPDPTDRTVTLVRRGKLTGVALTPAPAFDEARVSAVAASRDSRLELRLDEQELAGLRAVADERDTSMSDVVRSALRVHAVDRPVYALDASASTPSLVCDAWHAMNESSLGDSTDARARLAAHERFMRGVRAQFTTQTTSSASQIVPPGYQPLLADSAADRPLYAAASRGGLSDATPFVIPGALTEASVESAVDVVAENVQPTEGAAAFTGGTVTPVGVKGRFGITRELLDASNPAIDRVLFAALREDYNRQVEKQIYSELNTLQSGTITAGLVPSGAQARTSAGTALPADLRKALSTFVEVRKRRPRSVVASSRTTVAEALEGLDTTAWALRDLTVELSPWITGTAAGDGDVFVLADGDLWAWASPLLEFRYLEKAGPGLVELAVFGYFACKLVKPSGLASIRHT